MTSEFLSIGELSRLTGLTTHTLRFYEAAEVLQPARRASNGHRRYNRQDVLWLAFVLRLKLTGMPLAEIRRYAELRAAGEGTLSPRLAMLELHRQRLASRMAELAECERALDEKIGLYRRQLAGAKSPTRKARK